MSKLITPEGSYTGWIEGFTPRRYCTRLLLSSSEVVLCEVERPKAQGLTAVEDHHPSDTVTVGHIVVEVDSHGEAVLHGDFVAPQTEPEPDPVQFQ